MPLLMGRVSGGIFLLLQSDGESKVAIFLGEIGIVETCNGGKAAGFVVEGRAASIRHVDVVRVACFSLLAPGALDQDVF